MHPAPSTMHCLFKYVLGIMDYYIPDHFEPIKIVREAGPRYICISTTAYITK